MMTDNALAHFCISFEMREGGDTGMRGAEHRSFLLMFTHQIVRNGLLRKTENTR